MAENVESRVEQVADAVESLTIETGKQLDAIKDEVKIMAQGYQKDVKDLQEALKSGNKFSDKDAEAIVSAIMAKKQVEDEAKGILSDSAQRSLKNLSDPWDAKSDYFAWELKHAGGNDPKAARELLSAALQAAPINDTHKRMQHQATDVMILNALGNAWARHSGDVWDNTGGSFVKFFPKTARKWAAYQAAFLADITGKATVAPDDLASTSNWVPTGASPDVREMIMLASSVSSLFDHLRYAGAGTNYDLPVDLTDTVADYITETTAYTNPYAAADPTQLGHALVDAKCTFAFKKHRGRFIFSGELDEDSIVPILPRVRKKLFETMAHGEEDAWINGQLTASIDTGASAPGTYSIRKAHNGLRYFCSSGVVNSLVDAGSDNLSYADIMSARSTMGENGVIPGDLALIVGPACYMQLLKLTETVTADKFGSSAAIFTGELAKIAGMPVVVSRYVPQDMNASGIRDATTTTQTIAIVVNRNGWLACEKRDITIESVRLPQTDQTDVIAMRRMDMESLYGYASTAPKTACVIYNVDVALA